MISLNSISEYALGELSDALDLSEPSLFAELLKDEEAQLIYLIELMPYDASQENTIAGVAPIAVNAIGEFDFTTLGGVGNYYFSDYNYATEPSDTPANTAYLPLTTNPLQFDASILSGEDFRGSTPSFGAVRLLNGDGELDPMLDNFWSGRNVVVYAGSPDFERSKFVKVFDGVARDIEYTEDDIIINISDKSLLLDTEFTQNLYLGTGGVEGGDDINGTPKPLLYGECLNVQPTLIDAANLIYQVHDGSIEGVDEVYDRGVALTDGGNVADITSATVTAGQFKTQLSGGYIKLGSSPAGRITADVRGDNTGGYVNQSGAIISRLVQTKMGDKNFSTNDFDEGSFNTIDATITGKIGVFIDRTTTLRNVIDGVLTPLQCYWTFTRQGLLTAGVIDEPSVETYTITENEIEDGTISLIREIRPSWRIKLGYGRSWTVQSKDDLAAAATSAYQTFVSEAQRTVTSETRNIRTLTGSLNERSFNSLLVNEADAITELNRLDDIYKTRRRVFKISIRNFLFRLFIGDTVKLKLNRFGLDSGQNFIITAISEDAESATTTMELWG